MSIGSILGAIVIGAIIGILGRLLAPGRQRISIVVTIIVGIVAALIGTWIARAMGVADTAGIDWVELLIQLVLAVIGVTLASQMMGRRRSIV